MSLHFVKPTVAGVARFIKEVAYTGRYVYGRKHWRRVRAGGDPVPQHRPIGQFVELEAHHEGYITYEDYQEHQKILEMNMKGPRHSRLGPGDALLQGICRCRRHGSVMSVHYNNRARRKHWNLRCQGDHHRGGDQCASVPGPAIEGVIIQAVLDHLDVSLIDEARCLWKQEHRDWKRTHAGVSDELRRQADVVDRLRRRIMEDDGSRPNLRDMLDDEYEKAARKLESIKERAARQEEAPDPFTDARWDELARLCMDRVAIWEAPTTTDQDRKQLIRILIHQVVIEIVEAERIVLCIEWADGLPKTRIELFRTPYYHRLMWQWHLERNSPEEIVTRLGAMGARTQQGRAWSLPTVTRTLAILVQRARHAAAEDVPPVRLKPSDVMVELHASGLGAEEIASRLNTMGLFTRFRAPWSASSVRRVLLKRRR